ncbi:MAG: aminomethyl-transferring glycine dehydrogenase subunit GcvPB [Chloroflexi bacterium]|nr:aminomethyl-transferring glycine dehydrogenase subunit GcvPB [Chloroflexota bacterium]
MTEKTEQKVLEPLIYELSEPERKGVRMPEPDVPTTDIPADLLRDDLNLPEVSEIDTVRHFVRLSQLNHAIDIGFYPLGSCTMKYNPKVNEAVARLTGYAQVHPLQSEGTVQGNLALMYRLQQWLCEISGFKYTSLQPAAGAQGEFAGILMIRKYHLANGDEKRTKIIVPDSAHGTNPATTTMAGLEVINLASDEIGDIDLDELRKVVARHKDTLAGMMITVPSTLGVYEDHMVEVIEVVHEAGGLVYMDGANMNALLGVAKPAELGFDVMHYNLHKTFSTPHGGGGPGSGPVMCNDKLAPFRPGPVVEIVEEAHDEDDAPLYGWKMPEQSIGRLKAFHGNFGMHVRAYAYIAAYGNQLRDVTNYAVLNANYVRSRLDDTYKVPFNRTCGHEFVLEGRVNGVEDIHALDISKRLMDYGIHPPTNYFPLIVPEALLIEPTETESKEMLDQFCDVMLKIAQEAKDDPELLHKAPHKAPIRRVDEVQAAKQLVLCCQPVVSSTEERGEKPQEAVAS